MAFYVESTKAPGLRFKLIKFNKDTRIGTLLGDTGVPFERSLADDVLKKYGFKVVVVDEKVVQASEPA